jgi:signal transduction histidine kinase/AraC-like DNA-binding protein
MKLNIFRLVICITIFVGSGCSDQQPDSPTIGFSQCTGDDAWRKTMLEGMKRELSFWPDVNFVMKDAGGSTSLQIEHIEQLIEADVDVLIVSPNESEPITTVVEKAYQQGIPVVILDRKTNSDQYTAYVGADNLEVGRLAGSFATLLLKGRGSVLEISERPGSSADIERHAGFLEAIRPYPDFKIDKKLSADWEKRDLAKPLSKLLKEQPDFNLIFCQNDRRAYTAAQVLEKLGLQNEIKVIGVDGLPGKNNGIDLVSRGVLAATILYPTGGQESIQTAMSILRKKPFKRDNLLQITVIDSTNVRMMKLQNDKLISQQLDIERRQQKIEEQRAISENLTIIIYTISATLVLAVLFGFLSFYSLRENRKINRRLAIQNREISDQKDQIEQLARKADIEHEAKIEFFTNISHEFRTPLTLILAPIDDLLTQDYFRNPSVHQELTLVRKNALRLLRLVTQLLDFRKIESRNMPLHIKGQNLISFLKEIMKSFQKIARKRSIDFQLISREAEVELWFDPDMLDKVIFNLLSNAFKFTPDKGRIYLYVRLTPDQKAQIRIEDNGMGMSEIDLAHVFEMFYQGEGSYKSLGTGLGLALSKELIDLHQGTIRVESTPFKQTAFTIELPLGKAHFGEKELRTAVEEYTSFADSEVTEEVTSGSSMQVQVPRSSDQLVLVIEDNAELNQLLRQKIANWYEVLTASDGEEGLRMAFGRVPDLIICDLMLPKKDGLSVVDTLKADFRTSHIPVIILTARSTTEQQIEGIRTGADAYITKPFNLLFLQEMVNTLIQNRLLLREHYTSQLPIDASPGNTPNKLDRKFITDFTAYVEEHFGNSELSVEVVSEAMGMSRVQLYRKMKALLDVSVNEYIQQVRLNKARFLLRREEYTISDVAYQVGFSSPTYFSTAFKGKYNQTPMEYRKS